MEVKYDQANFTLGEIDPKTQQRTDWEGYYKALKFLRNGLVIPQGGFTGRWGSKYVTNLTLTDANRPLEAEISVLIYDDNSTYLLVWQDLTLQIYLENILVEDAIVSPYTAEDIENIRPTQIQDRLIIASSRIRPYQLVRSANAPNTISGVDTVNNFLQLTTPIDVQVVYPVIFTTTGTLPVTNPAIYVGVTYFIKAETTTNVRVYSTAQDAAAGINYYTVISGGAGVNTLSLQNTWTLSPINFKFYPAYDFSGGYDAITFTPSATTGNITLTASAAIFTPAMIGGLFTGNGGVMRITGFSSTTSVTGFTVDDFTSTDPIPGNLAFLGEPAWSDLRGWPALASSYQSRSVFARTVSIPNGRWLSVVNDVYNFDDSMKLDDDAISNYPNGSGVGFIQALTSARTLVVHTNTNTQSSPVLNEVPITPTNATFPEQSKFGAIPIQPIFLDNQIIFVDKAYNVINMIWEITQSAFVTNSISVPSSNLIRQVIDMAAFAQPTATDGFYALFINSDGTMAVFQSLLEQNVKGWSLMDTKTQQVIDTNSNGLDIPSSFVRVTTGNDRCWILVVREVAAQLPAVAITGFSSVANTLTAVAHGISLTQSTLVSFATIGTLPTTSPQINTTQYWFGRGVDANTIALYTNKVDADADTNRILISSAGVSSTVSGWPFFKNIYLEEVSFDFRQDCVEVKTFSVPTTVITGLEYLNGCVVKVVADGYVLTDKVVFNGSITLEIGALEVIVGTQFIVKGVPLPVSVPGVMGVLYSPTHIRAMYIAYVDSIGVTIQGGNIPTIDMQEVVLDEVPQPKTGVYLYTPMEGWDSFSYDLEIIQANPLPITIAAFSYKMET
jgi:hypothetical protein